MEGGRCFTLNDTPPPILLPKQFILMKHLGVIKWICWPIHTHTNPWGSLVTIYNHQATSPLHEWPVAYESGDLEILESVCMVIHDTKFPYWDQVSLHNTNTNPLIIIMDIDYSVVYFPLSIGLNIFYLEEKDWARHTTRHCPLQDILQVVKETVLQNCFSPSTILQMCGTSYFEFPFNFENTFSQI